MGYDEDLADRVRALVADEPRVAEQRMFGGLAFLVGGHLAVAVSGQGGLLVRVDPTASTALLDEPGVRPMEMRGREMKGWLRVDATAVGPDDGLERWVGTGVAFARTLPAK